MKDNINTWMISSFLAANLLATGTFASTLCTSTSTYDDHKTTNSSQWDDGNGDEGYCALTPDSMLLKVYEFGLCTGASSPTDKSNCTTLFESAAGTTVDLAVGVSASLTDNISLIEGTYTNAYLVLSNVTSLKSIMEFDTPRTDFDGNTGKFCYTDGRSVDDDEDSIMTCSNSAAGATHSVETINFYDWQTGNHTSQVPNYQATVAGTSTTTDLYMIKSDGQLSGRFEDDFAIYGDQTLAQPVTISPSTTALDLGISVTNGVSFGFYEPGDNGQNGTGGCGLGTTDGCPGDSLFNGLKFVISAS